MKEMKLDEAVERELSGIVQQPTEVGEAFKEMFDNKKISMITDLTPNEIVFIQQIDFNTAVTTNKDLKGLEVLKGFTEGFMQKKLSQNRKSRMESVAMLQSQNDKKSGDGFMNRLMGRGGRE